MATFKSGFGLHETFPTALGGSKGQAAAPYATEAIVAATASTAAFNPSKSGFGVALGTVHTTSVVGTTLGGGVTNPKDGFGLPLTMAPHKSSIPLHTATFKSYASTTTTTTVS
jgi:hypothetical protein